MPFELGIVLVLAAFAPQDEPAGYEYQEEAVIEAALEEVMSRSEFRRLVDEPDEDEDSGTPPWLERLMDWLEELFGGASVPDASPRPGLGMVYLVYALAAATVVGVLFLIARAILDASREKAVRDSGADASIVHADKAPGETSPDEFWARAQTLASRGEFKPAIRELLLGAMSTLERRGLIRHRKGLTNLDYYWAARGAARASIRTIITAFELAYFGRREVTGEGFRECAHAYRQSFAGDASSTAAGTAEAAGGLP